MNLTKQDYLNCIQACINEYHGSYGKVKEILSGCTSKETDQHLCCTIGVLRKEGAELDDLYIVFRGTKGKKGWINNFNYKQRPCTTVYQKAYIHCGFEKDLNSIIDFVYDAIQEHQLYGHIGRIIVTGHSKGASVSLMLYDFLNKLLNINVPIYCVAFAPARVGNYRFRKKFKKDNAVIFINRNDTVTKVPYCIMPGLKWHKTQIFNQHYWISILDYFHPCKKIRLNITWWYKILLCIPIIRQILLCIGNPLNHNPAEYQKGIYKMKEK